MAWRNIVERKRGQQTEALAPFASAEVSTCISDEADIENLQKEIYSGHATVEDIINDYIARAYAAHTRTNCLTEVMFSDALKQAKDLDQNRSSIDMSKKPLFGVPVTFKDQFNIQGYDTTLGYVGRSFLPAAEDCVLVKLLKSLGAVVLAKTNLPQSIMVRGVVELRQNENPLFGLTVNPTDEDYTPGGSTGGEAALLAQKGSLLSWGTDIGGSIRIPSHMMGLYGLKPSSARLPYRGVSVSTEGQEHVPSSVGPMARSLSSIYTALKCLIDAQPWQYDSRCAPIPWRKDMYEAVINSRRPLTFGVLRDDGLVLPHPPVARVLAQTIAKLKAAGHHTVEWDATLHADLVGVMDAFYSADGGEDIRRDVSQAGEPFIPHVARLVSQGPPISVYDYWQLNRRKIELQNAYLDKWNAVICPATGRPVDAIILPPMPHTAVPHRACGWVGYTKVWNVLDYPALVIPAGKVEQGDLKASWESSGQDGRHAADSRNRMIWVENCERMADLQLPVGVQVVCRKLEEEKLLGIGKLVDDLVRNDSSSALW